MLRAGINSKSSERDSGGQHAFLVLSLPFSTCFQEESAMVALITSSSRQLRTALALLAVRKSQWSFERLAQELRVDDILVKSCWRTLLENAWHLYPSRARLKAGHWQPDASVKAMIALAAYRARPDQIGDIARQYGVSLQDVEHWRRILVRRAGRLF